MEQCKNFIFFMQNIIDVLYCINSSQSLPSSYMNKLVFPWVIYLKTLAISIIIRNCGTNLNTTIEKESVRSSSQLFSSEVNQTTSTKAGLTILYSFCSQRLARSHSLNPFFLSVLLISLETLLLLFFLSLQKWTEIFIPFLWTLISTFGVIQPFKDRG